MVRSNIYRDRHNDVSFRLSSWVNFFIVGVIMGLIAFIIDVIVELLHTLKWDTSQHFLSENYNPGLSFFLFILFAIIYSGSAAALTVFVGPGAAGGGVPELMGYMNGVIYPDFMGVRTLLVKIFALALAVASGLCVGKEGPLAHIGAIVGPLVLYIPLKFFEFFRNDEDKREIAAAGCAAGVSAAFGSPIGGSLFAYEISRPSTFWSFGLMWKIFFCSSISTFVLNILNSLKEGKGILVINAGLIKFGTFNENPYKISDIPSFIFLGVLGGILGAVFIFVNYRISVLRKKFLTTKIKKILEVLCLAFLTAVVTFWAPWFIKCRGEGQNFENITYIQYTCPEGAYNPLATLLFNTEGAVIKAFMNSTSNYNYAELLIFFVIWYMFTIITYGTNVPAGIFLPGIMIGASVGRMLGLLLNNVITFDVSSYTYSIIGAAAFLGGTTRLSFALAVIMLETTNNVGLFLPIVFTLFVCFGVGRIYNRSIYVNGLRVKSIPFLVEHVPRANNYLKAENIMCQIVRCCKPISKVKDIYELLKDEHLNGYPVVDSDNKLVGLISRNYLSTIILKKAWF